MGILSPSSLFVFFYFPVPLKLNAWPMFMWVVSYGDGVVSRGLIGTLLTSVFGFVPNTLIVAVYCIVYLSTSIYAAYFFTNAIKAVEGEPTNTLCFFGVLFCTNPGALAYLMTEANTGRFDILWILLMFLSISLIIKDKLLFLIPAISVCGVLIHQAYVF